MTNPDLPAKTADWSAVSSLVARLEALKADVERTEGKPLSDQKFATRFLLGLSATTWSRVKSCTYAGSLPSVAEKLAVAIKTIEEQLPALAEVAKYVQSFVRTQFAVGASEAIKNARAGVEDRRVVLLLAPTGFGKTAIARYLATTGAVTVEGRQAWRTSYKAFCADIAAVLGRNVPLTWPEGRLEREMFDAFSARSGILCIDEANTMSAACANAIKSIVNRTDYTVVLAAIPEMWDKFLAGNRGEVLQLLNRCQVPVRATAVSERDASLFLESRGIPPAPFARKIAAAANAFGGFRTVVSIVNRLAETGNPTSDDLAAELRVHAENLAAAGLSAPR